MSLTIMFSKECLASQQLRNTGMKRFLKEGTITCREKTKLQSAWQSVTSLFSACAIQSQDLLQGNGWCERVSVVLSFLFNR